MTVQEEIDQSFAYGHRLEELIANRQFPLANDRDALLVGLWALLFDYHAAILTLLNRDLFGAAFALVRPVMEALLRAHVLMMCSDQDVLRIKGDKYKVDFSKVGVQIDKAFDLDFFARTLKQETRDALHSYTHSGNFQISRRFDGNQIKPHYSDGAVINVLEATTNAVFMATVLVTKKLGFETEWQSVNEMFDEYRRRYET